MKFRKDSKNPAADPAIDQGRDEIREMAEALSLYGSAMRHLAERAPARPFVAGQRPAHSFHLRLLLAPALTALLAAGVFVPVYSYSHHHTVQIREHAKETEQSPATVANVDDTALMNQIDSELSQDVPDALLPLADLSAQTTTTTNVSEKKNATHE
jgi:hypothetical protein